MYSDWTQGVDEVAKINLDKPLIIRDPETLSISVNFDPKVKFMCCFFLSYLGVVFTSDFSCTYIFLALPLVGSMKFFPPPPKVRNMMA